MSMLRRQPDIICVHESDIYFVNGKQLCIGDADSVDLQAGWALEDFHRLQAEQFRQQVQQRIESKFAKYTH